MDFSSYQTLLLSREDAILTITLNRPQVMNATNALMDTELARVFLEAAVDAQTRVIVVTGAGKAFAAGGDFDYMQTMQDDPAQFWDGMVYAKRLVFSMLDCSKPIVAKINGHAMGLGATIALFCDVTFAAEHVKIADPHVAIGFVAGDGGAVIWPQLIGYNRAKEYLFTGEPITAVDAARIGLINHAVPADQLDATVEKYARKVAAMPARAVQWTKASVNIGLKQIAHSVMDASIAYEALSNSTADHREALDALRAKRAPQFRGN